MHENSVSVTGRSFREWRGLSLLFLSYVELTFRNCFSCRNDNSEFIKVLHTINLPYILAALIKKSTLSTLSLPNQINTPTATSLQHLKSLLPSKFFFSLLHIVFYEKPVLLINKLKPLSYQSSSNLTPRLPLHTSQPTLKYTLLHYSHFPNIKLNYLRKTFLKRSLENFALAMAKSI